MIPQAFIDEVQSRTDIVEVVGSYIPLRKAGRNFKALCPFHGEKTPSFVVSPQKQIFHCFGCGQGGGVIQFILLQEKVDFVEGVEILARRLGMEVPFQRGAGINFKPRLYEAADKASLFFHANILSKEASGAREYLAKRGVGSKDIKFFRLGLAWGQATLLKHLRSLGYRLETIEKASLAISKPQGYRDLFSYRIMFPIFDVRSRVVGFGARAYRDNIQGPKYINSPENALYSKRDHLYGLNFSKDSIAEKDSVIIVEGYLDMITPYAAGIKNIVASLGTALTAEQIKVIRRYTTNVVFVFDADKAGVAASMRALDLALENDLKAGVVSLPSGCDPDSLVRTKGKEGFLKYLDLKQDFFDFKMDILKRKYDIGTIEGKTKITKDILATIAKLTSEVARYEYIKKLSFILGIGEEIIISEFKNSFGRLKQLSSPLVSFKEKFSVSPSITEKILLKFMFTNKKAADVVCKNVKGEDFSPGPARQTAEMFFKYYSARKEVACANFISFLSDSSLSAFVSELLMDEEIPQDKEALRGSILKLRKNRAKLLREQLRREIKRAEEAGDDRKLRVLISRHGKLNSEVRNG